MAAVPGGVCELPGTLHGEAVLPGSQGSCLRCSVMGFGQPGGGGQLSITGEAWNRRVMCDPRPPSRPSPSSLPLFCTLLA